MQIQGYMVVRRPEMNCDQQGRGAYRRTAPRLGEISYFGIDRMAWFDIDEAYYDGDLPESLRHQYRLLAEQNDDATGIRLLTDLLSAQRLLEHSNQPIVANEMIAVRSERLTQVKKSVAVADEHITWLGLDVVGLGHFSLIEGGLFADPGSFPDWRGAITPFGLLRSELNLEWLVQCYMKGEAAGRLEPVPFDLSSVCTIEVGLVNDAIRA